MMEAMEEEEMEQRQRDVDIDEADVWIQLVSTDNERQQSLTLLHLLRNGFDDATFRVYDVGIVDDEGRATVDHFSGVMLNGLLVRTRALLCETKGKNDSRQIASRFLDTNR